MACLEEYRGLKNFLSSVPRGLALIFRLTSPISPDFMTACQKVLKSFGRVLHMTDVTPTKLDGDAFFPGKGMSLQVCISVSINRR